MTERLGAARAFYLRVGEEPVLARFDALDGPHAGRAVLLVPPFGWEEICSYRPRRFWARHLAARGVPVLRIDLPGTGDSGGGAWDADRLGAWTRAVAEGARWLAAETGGTARVTLVGLGIGGLIGWRAVAEEAAPVDDLVLWGVRAQGRALVREIKAFARLERSKLVELNPGRDVPDDGDGLTAAGFTIAPETIDALGRTDLAEIALPAAPGRRVLLLGRDGTTTDAALEEAARAAGAEVSVEPGAGWGAMVDEPQLSAAPWATVALVDAWLDAGASAPAGIEPSPAPTVTADALIATPAGPVRERPLRIGGIDGIVAEPGGGAPVVGTLLLLNAGSVRRVGPNRMWVELARRWAPRGVRTVRLDLTGIGEADGDETLIADGRYYERGFVTAVREVMDALQARDGDGRFAALGLCSGAYWALHAAAQDDRLRAAYAINPRALVWHESLQQRRDTRKLSYLWRSSTYRRVLRGDIPLRRGAEIAAALLRRLVASVAGAPARLARRPAAGDPVEQLLDDLRDRGTEIYLLFTGGEAVHEELDRTGLLHRRDRWPSLRVDELLALRDVHTLQPRAVQREVHVLLDAAIARDVSA